jgi:hypothetical protein
MENKMYAIQEDKNLPLITVGVVVLNREWIIKKCLTPCSHRHILTAEFL